MTQLNVPSSTIPGKIQPSGQYFQQRKKGQMNELKNQLNNVINENDVKKGKQVIKKVIGYMTLGMDASPVFSQMCRASFINDQIMKKMIYFYLTTYAEDNPDLSIMAINTFKKDCKHTSAKIRGLALRNLCSFRSSDYVNSVLPTIRQLLMDFDSYVKKTAIMGVLKVFYHDPTVIITDSSILDSLSSAIKDSDPLVSINAIMALDEILVSEGGLPLNRKLFFYLLNRLKQYNEWQQSTIIDILYRYDPGNQKQNYQIMTLLWQNLKRSSTALVLGSIRIIVKLAKQKQELFKNVVDKIKAPLLTLMSSNQNNGCYQTTFIVLQHIQYVIRYMNGKAQYQKDFKYFYCKNDEPTYIKSLKVKILGMLANQYNLGDMLNELNDYASEVDIQIARKAVTTLAEIAIRLPQVSKALLINLVAFYRTQQEHLVNSTVISFYKILRKYPKLFSDVRTVLIEHHSIINQTESIKAFIWILGTFADQIDDAPYILEQYVDDQQKFNELKDQVKQILLTQIVQTFVKRPPQTIKALGKVFKLIFQNDKSSVILLDHAAFYYRALKDNPQQIKKGFHSIQSEMTKQKEQIVQVNAEEDFNNLGIIYKKKQIKFIKNYQYFISMRNKQLGLIQPPAIEDDEEQINEDIIEEKPDLPVNFGLDQQLQNTQLQTNITLTAEQFQQTWNSLQSYNQVNCNLQNQEYLDQQSVQELFKMWNLYSMASAQQQQGKILKFYMYAKHYKGGFICIQVQIKKNDKILTLTTKATQQNLAILINRYVQQFLTMNEFII